MSTHPHGRTYLYINTFIYIVCEYQVLGIYNIGNYLSEALEVLSRTLVFQKSSCTLLTNYLASQWGGVLSTDAVSILFHKSEILA